VVLGATVAIPEFPTVFAHVRVDDGKRNRVFEALELAEDQCPVCPGAGQRNIKMIATGLGREAAVA
jgi:hypothetical protein